MLRLSAATRLFTECNRGGFMSAVKVERLGRIARVTLNRPEVKNAFNDEIVLELEEAFKTLAGEAHVVVLAGAGDAFVPVLTSIG